MNRTVALSACCSKPISLRFLDENTEEDRTADPAYAVLPHHLLLRSADPRELALARGEREGPHDLGEFVFIGILSAEPAMKWTTLNLSASVLNDRAKDADTMTRMKLRRGLARRQDGHAREGEPPVGRGIEAIVDDEIVAWEPQQDPQARTRDGPARNDVMGFGRIVMTVAREPINIICGDDSTSWMVCYFAPRHPRTHQNI